MAEERDASGGTVTKRFFTQGEQISGTNYYFTKDHLGSVMEMTDASGAIKARYSYDPYGRRTKISGSVDADFGFTGHYYHTTSGLYLTLYRAYDSNLGKWLSRDPKAEVSGINLYEYVYNNPTRYFDLFGLDIWIEGPNQNEPDLHQSVNVGNPNSDYNSYSFGLNTSDPLHIDNGVVYNDTQHGGDIEQYKKTTPDQDQAFKNQMDNELGKKGNYPFENICRSYSQKQFDGAPGTPSNPPPRTVDPHVPNGTILPSISTTTSSSGSWTSR